MYVQKASTDKRKGSENSGEIIANSRGKSGSRKTNIWSQIYASVCSARRAFELTPNMMQEIFETAKEDGWSIVQCDGEADVHIGSLT